MQFPAATQASLPELRQAMSAPQVAVAAKAVAVVATLVAPPPPYPTTKSTLPAVTHLPTPIYTTVCVQNGDDTMVAKGPFQLTSGPSLNKSLVCDSVKAKTPGWVCV